MEKKYLIKFILIEIFTMVLFSLSYRIFRNILPLNLIIINIISLTVSLLFDYIFLTKFVYTKYRNRKYDLIKFVIFNILGIFLMKYISNIILYRFLLFPVLISKGISLFLVLIYFYIVKNFIFNELKISNWKEPFVLIIDYWNKIINFKYIKPIFKFLPNNCLLFIYLVVSIFFGVRFFNMFDDILLYRQGVASATIGDFINTTHTISFSNVEKLGNNPNKICIVFKTYLRENNSNLIFNLYNGDNLLYTNTINTKILNDGQDYCYDVPEINKEKINDYKLDVISTNADDNNNVTILMNDQTKEEAFSLKRHHDIVSFKYIIIALFILLFLLVCYLINKKGDKITPEKMLLIFMMYILAELFIMPPMQVPDESFHFMQSYSLSQKWLDIRKNNEISVPSNINCLDYSNVAKNNKVMDTDDIALCLKESENTVKRTDLFGMTANKSSTFLGYFSSTIALKLADIISDSPLLIFYLSRIGSFIVSFIILFFAIKMTPKYKNIMLLIGVLPMFIQQMNSLSYDSILNSVVMLYYAFILRKINDNKVISVKDVIIPVISLLMVYAIKMVYIFLFVLLFFIPKERFKTTKRKILYIVIVAFAIFLGVYLIQKIVGVSDSAFNTDSYKQIQYIMHNPLNLFPIAINTLKSKTWFYLQGIVGYFGWWAFSFNNITIYSWFIMFILLCLNEKNVLTNKTNNKFNYNKIVLLITILLMIAAVFASMYFCWSAYKLDYVEGVQGRYFIPILFAIAIFIIPKKSRIIEITNKSVYLYCNILLVQYLLYLIIFFY